MDISYFTHSFFLHSHLLQVFPSVLSSVVMSAYDEIIARAASVDLSGFHNGFPPVRYSPSQFDSVVVLDMILRNQQHGKPCSTTSLIICPVLRLLILFSMWHYFWHWS